MNKVKTAVPGAVQAVGGLAAGVGLYLLAGLAWTLLVAGVAAVVVATLAEMNGGR